MDRNDAGESVATDQRSEDPSTNAVLFDHGPGSRQVGLLEVVLNHDRVVPFQLLQHVRFERLTAGCVVAYLPRAVCDCLGIRRESFAGGNKLKHRPASAGLEQKSLDDRLKRCHPEVLFNETNSARAAEAIEVSPMSRRTSAPHA
jgi:hypothetical protein